MECIAWGIFVFNCLCGFQGLGENAADGLEQLGLLRTYRC